MTSVPTTVTNGISQLIKKPRFRYLSAWFCPFAHRATIALEHHADRVDYEWIEALGWHQRDDSIGVTGTGTEWYYHWKADELKRVNPSALVPTLIPVNDDGTPDESKAVWESLVTIDYIDAVSGAAGTSHSLNPVHDPYEAARCRIWAEKVNKECCSPYYGVLVRKDPMERAAHFEKLIRGLSNFSNELQRTSGKLFLPNNQLSNVDIALIPWAYRYYVLEHYRGVEYRIPISPELQSYHEWYEYVIHLPAVQRTLPDKERYLEHIKKYADGSARSKVANAVRRGVAAHDFDDKEDDYHANDERQETEK